jgi:hypothetical protein
MEFLLIAHPSYKLHKNVQNPKLAKRIMRKSLEAGALRRLRVVKED